MEQAEEKLLLARLSDLEQRAERGHKPCFSRFLDPGEIMICKQKLHPAVPYMFWGGYEEAERQMIGFFPDYMEPDIQDFPLRALRIRSKEDLGHRTVLGSVMGLGLERNQIGDVAMEEAGPVLFACDSICDYICLNLTRVGRAHVSVTQVPFGSLAVLPKAWTAVGGTVASLRLDCVLGLLTGVSRSGAEELLKREMVSVNHKVTTKGSVLLSAGDTLSVRKFGRAEILEIGGETKKGRTRIQLKKYI